ncbi:YncE family protein [Streptomyces sp. NPDC004134]|uniref:YncE family protein n=1 Tax=Streptomyces sp. NPDC004134 TaxID=3364691 RepID=UPI0036BA9527
MAVELPISSYWETVVESSRQRVFLSDPTGDSVLVTDYEGQTVAHLTGMAGASGLALSPDSGTVYVALRDADAIAAIDTDTLTETARYATSPNTPVSLAPAGGKIWFGYSGTEPLAPGDIGSLDVSGEQPVLRTEQGGSWNSAPLLASAPAAPDRLVAGEKNLAPASVASYDVSTGTAQLLDKQRDFGPEGSDYLTDIAVSADGESFLPATDVFPRSELQVFDIDDLSFRGAYPMTTDANSVDIAPDGTVAAGAYQSDGDDLHVFKPGAYAPLQSVDLDLARSSYLLPRGVVWAPDRSRIFVVSRGADSFSLHVLDGGFGTAPTALALDAPATSKKNRELTVTGALTPAGTFGPGTAVTVTRYDDGHPTGFPGGSATVGADGAFSFTDRPSDPGQVTYEVSYAGDDWHTTATGAATVEITR